MDCIRHLRGRVGKCVFALVVLFGLLTGGWALFRQQLSPEATLQPPVPVPRPTIIPQPLVLRFFYTGQLLGELEPCGCSGTKLGGILLRSGWVHHLGSLQERLYLIDGGFAAPDPGRQTDIKFQIYRDALQKLGYHEQFVGSDEYLPLEELAAPAPQFLAANRPPIPIYHMREITHVGESCKILFMALEKESSYDAAIKEKLDKLAPDVVWVMAKGISAAYQTLIPPGRYFTVIFPVESQEPFSPLTLRDDMILVSAGNRGRYAGLLTLTWEKKHVQKWENRTIALEKKFEVITSIAKLLEDYKRQLKDERLLEKQIKESSPIGFVGADFCKSCHWYEYAEWQKKKHAHAFTTLENEGHDYDPECVGCHTVGYAFEEGFRTPEETPHLKHVGCEVCHGPSAEHVMKPDLPYGKKPDEAICLTCHQRNRSPHFDFSKDREKIQHWRNK